LDHLEVDEDSLVLRLREDDIQERRDGDGVRTSDVGVQTLVSGDCDTDLVLVTGWDETLRSIQDHAIASLLVGTHAKGLAIMEGVRRDTEHLVATDECMATILDVGEFLVPFEELDLQNLVQACGVVRKAAKEIMDALSAGPSMSGFGTAELERLAAEACFRAAPCHVATPLDALPAPRHPMDENGLALIVRQLGVVRDGLLGVSPRTTSVSVARVSWTSWVRRPP